MISWNCWTDEMVFSVRFSQHTVNPAYSSRFWQELFILMPLKSENPERKTIKFLRTASTFPNRENFWDKFRSHNSWPQKQPRCVPCFCQGWSCVDSFTIRSQSCGSNLLYQVLTCPVQNHLKAPGCLSCCQAPGLPEYHRSSHTWAPGPAGEDTSASPRKREGRGGE